MPGQGCPPHLGGSPILPFARPGQPVYLPGGTPVAVPAHPATTAPHRPPVLPTTAGLTNSVVPPAKQPVIRLHSQPLPPKTPSRLLLPTPEALGIGGTKSASMPVHAAPVDWNLAHQYLKELGAVGFHLDHPSAGQVRVTFWLPTADPGRTQLIESTAGSESAAVSAALQQAHSFRVAAK